MAMKRRARNQSAPKAATTEQIFSGQWQRCMLKVSGEMLGGPRGQELHGPTLKRVAENIRAVTGRGKQVAVVVGAGNLIRGTKAKRAGIDRILGDNAGMLGTAINALAIQSHLRTLGVETHVQGTFAFGGYVEPYNHDRAKTLLDEGKVVIFAGGTGNPFFSTDTAAVLRAAELECDLIFKATKVNGVYDGDPERNKNAKRFASVNFKDALHRDLQVMDRAAFALLMTTGTPLIVFSLLVQGGFSRVAEGQGNFTRIAGDQKTLYDSEIETGSTAASKKKASKKTGKKASRKVSKKTGKKASKKTGKKTGKKASKKTGKKASKKTGKKVASRKTARKATRKTGKKKVAKKATGKTPAKRKAATKRKATRRK